jgi:hypothetical protein
VSGVSPNDYFDLGSWQTWNFMNGPNGTLNQDELNQYLDSYVAQAKDAGLNEVTFSFAQVCDISKMVSGDFGECSHDDALWMLSVNTSNAQIDGKSFFQYVVQRVHADGLKAALSFGGESAGTGNPNDWDFGFSTTNPVLLAENLANWAQQTGLSSIDFDVESPTLTSLNSPADLALFFAQLHKDAQANGMPVTLTVMSDAGLWGPTGQYFGSLFSQGTDITHMFDGINLMLYNGQYYINAGQTPPQSWDLLTWISQLQSNSGMSPADCASFLHLGFNGAIDYSKQSSSCGPLPYDPSKVPPGVKTSGQYAAYILSVIQDELREKYGDPNLQFGASFFWDDNANYQVGTNGQYQSQFFQNNPFESEFYRFLESLE